MLVEKIFIPKYPALIPLVAMPERFNRINPSTIAPS
jgi:hypothetical protein